jgi:TusA-related sulfurtransferase
MFFDKFFLFIDCQTKESAEVKKLEDYCPFPVILCIEKMKKYKQLDIICF